MLPSGFAFRSLRLDDIPAVREIDRLSFDSDDQYAQEFYKHIFTAGRFRALVAEQQGRVLGWVLVDLSQAVARIRTLATHPGVRRMGCGRGLMAQVMDLAGERPMDLLVKPDNEAAINLYEHCGFHAMGVDPELPNRIRMIRGT